MSLTNRRHRSYLRKSPKKLRSSILSSILRVKQELHGYWQTLPTVTYCRDLTPGGPLLRFNIHLALTYHLAHVFIGRIFILSSSRNNNLYTPLEQNISDWSEIQTALVSGCVQSALDIIELCQTLQNEVGLARASYTEFTSCRGALLVILAQQIQERSADLRMASEQGIKLLKYMSLGLYAASAEKSAIEAMETAIRRLDDSSQDQNIEKAGRNGSGSSAYDQFRNWALLWKKGDTETTKLADPCSSALATEYPTTIDTSSLSNLLPLQNFGWDVYSPSFPFEIDEFASVMDFNQ